MDTIGILRCGVVQMLSIKVPFPLAIMYFVCYTQQNVQHTFTVRKPCVKRTL